MMTDLVLDRAFINAKRTVEGMVPNPAGGWMRQQKNGKDVSRYVVNREEPGKMKIKMTRSYLRSEILIQPTLTNYPFAILTNQVAPGSTGVNPTEQRLKQQDVFFCNRLGFYIYIASSSGGNTNYKYELLTFMNPIFYGSSINLDLAQGLWTTGELQVTVNNDVLTPGWDLLQHGVINQTQVPGLPLGSSPYFNQVDYSKDGLITVEPQWVLNGGNDNQYVINYPQSINSIGIAGAQIWLVLKWEGFLAQNCSSIMDNNG
jgi:hypothetical protein